MKDKKTLSHFFFTVSLAITLFLIPTNLFFKITTNEAYVHGVLSDYLLPKIYLSDLWILVSVIFLVWSARDQVADQIKTLKNNLLRYVLISILLVTHLLFSSSQITALLILKFLIFYSYISLLYIKRHHIINKYVKFSLMFTLFFQSAVALFQYHFQKSLYGYLFLGEPNLLHYAGIAKQQLFGSEKILPYGTTAHPNVLAGVIVVYLFLLLQLEIKERHFNFNWAILFKICVAILALTTVFLTQSFSAMIAAIFVCCSTLLEKNFRFKTKIFALTSAVLFITVPLVLQALLSTGFYKNTSIIRRAYLNRAGAEMFLDHPVMGVGLGNFTRHVEEYATNNEVVRFVQPAHHAGILFFSEWGLLGLVLIALYTKKLKTQVNKKTVERIALLMLILTPLATLDHYLYTLQTGLLLVIVSLLILASADSKKTST